MMILPKEKELEDIIRDLFSSVKISKEDTEIINIKKIGKVMNSRLKLYKEDNFPEDYLFLKFALNPVLNAAICTDIYVSEDNRNNGIGTESVKQLEKMIKMLNGDMVFVKRVTNDMFWSKMGYEKTNDFGPEIDYYKDLYKPF